MKIRARSEWYRHSSTKIFDTYKYFVQDNTPISTDPKVPTLQMSEHRRLFAPSECTFLRSKHSLGFGVFSLSEYGFIQSSTHPLSASFRFVRMFFYSVKALTPIRRLFVVGMCFYSVEHSPSFGVFSPCPNVFLFGQSTHSYSAYFGCPNVFLLRRALTPIRRLFVLSERVFCFVR